MIKVEFDDAVRQSSNLSEKQKKKYIILTRTENKDTSDKSATTTATTGKLDQVPEPRLTLFRREQVMTDHWWLTSSEFALQFQVEIGYRTTQGGPGSGMFNMGNTCYLNSTLQVKTILYRIISLQFYLVRPCSTPRPLSIT